VTELSLENVRERAREVEEEHHEPIRKVIAVVIMSISVLVASTAYFETRAGDREALAQRIVQEATITSMAANVAATRDWSEETATSYMYEELALLAGDALQPASAYGTALQQAYTAAAAKVACGYAGLFGEQFRLSGSPCEFDYWRFYEAQERAPTLAGAQTAAAAQAERDWGGERGRLVTVITIFAVSLFLIGLTLTVPPAARMPFLWLGSLAAMIALIWGIVIIASPVKSPSQRSIIAYADGAAAGYTAYAETSSGLPAAAVSATTARAIAALSTAIAEGEDGSAPYIARGGAYLESDLHNSRGPQGSPSALTDFSHAVSLDPANYAAWGDLGAAQFWLGDYAGSLSSTEKALSLHGDPTFDMNVALDDVILGRMSDYRKALAQLRRRLEQTPSWIRNAIVSAYATPIRDAVTYRPAIADRVAAFGQDLHAIADSITVAEKTYGRTTAPPSPAIFKYVGYKLAGAYLTFDFSVSGLQPQMKYTDWVYVDNTPWGAYGPKPWSQAAYKLSSGPFDWRLTSRVAAGWPRGTRVLMEIFMDGSLRVAKEIVVS
jgi:tetratricopeptide (TPR) repeat protein